MTLYWPTKVLKAQGVSSPYLAARNLSGVALSGRAQASSTDAGAWVYEIKNIPIYDRNKILTWRAIEGLLEGRLTPINVPLYNYELAFAPYALGLDYTSMLVPVPHSDGSYHSDGGGYVSSIASVSVNSAAALRAISFVVTVTYGPTLQAGMMFSINHTAKGHRWYKVRTYDSSSGALTFRPPLREAILAGTTLEFDRPVCRMRLADDSAMSLDLSAPHFGFPSVQFVEDL